MQQIKTKLIWDFAGDRCMKYLIVIISFMMLDVNMSKLLKLSGCEQ